MLLAFTAILPEGNLEAVEFAIDSPLASSIGLKPIITPSVGPQAESNTTSSDATTISLTLGDTVNAPDNLVDAQDEVVITFSAEASLEVSAPSLVPTSGFGVWSSAQGGIIVVTATVAILDHASNQDGTKHTFNAKVQCTDGIEITQYATVKKDVSVQVLLADARAVLQGPAKDHWFKGDPSLDFGCIISSATFAHDVVPEGTTTADLEVKSVSQVSLRGEPVAPESFDYVDSKTFRIKIGSVNSIDAGVTAMIKSPKR